jgi:hypothetical protein
MTTAIPPAPIRDPWGSYTWEDWFRLIRNRATESLTSVSWSGIDFTGSNITSILNRKHNDLTNIQGGTSAEYYHLTSANYSNLTGGTPTFNSLYLNDNLILPKTSGEGIKVDPTSPTFGWKDLLGDVVPKTAGLGAPTLAVFRDNLRWFNYAAADDLDILFHIPHDYVQGTDMHLHVHWAHNGTNISGSISASVYASYAKGHQQENFPSQITATLTVGSLNITNTPQYHHRVDEIQISSSGGSSSTFNTDLIEPDGVVLIHFNVDTIPTITGGTGKPFIFAIDLHYQSTGLATKNKTPNFYS